MRFYAKLVVQVTTGQAKRQARRRFPASAAPEHCSLLITQPASTRSSQASTRLGRGFFYVPSQPQHCHPKPPTHHPPPQPFHKNQIANFSHSIPPPPPSPFQTLNTPTYPPAYPAHLILSSPRPPLKPREPRASIQQNPKSLSSHSVPFMRGAGRARARARARFSESLGGTQWDLLSYSRGGVWDRSVGLTEVKWRVGHGTLTGLEWISVCASREGRKHECE